jgi:hypothetical protein
MTVQKPAEQGDAAWIPHFPPDKGEMKGVVGAWASVGAFSSLPNPSFKNREIRIRAKIYSNTSLSRLSRLSRLKSVFI